MSAVPWEPPRPWDLLGVVTVECRDAVESGPARRAWAVAGNRENPGRG